MLDLEKVAGSGLLQWRLLAKACSEEAIHSGLVL